LFAGTWVVVPVYVSAEVHDGGDDGKEAKASDEEGVVFELDHDK
jgi:hypothetical protein